MKEWHHLTDAALAALQVDKTIDIVTTGAKTGRMRRTEIWFTRVGDRIIICGTPSDGRRARRDWLANLKSNPAFLFCLKESTQVDLQAIASVIVDEEDRRAIMSAPATRWYRDHVASFEDLVRYGPIVEVDFVPS